MDKTLNAKRDSLTDGRDILIAVKRLSTLILALLIGAAAPVRAWCEATCLAPAQQSESAAPHCPSHDQSPDRSAMSTESTAVCPAIDAARPIQAKLDFGLAPIAIAAHAVAAPPDSAKARRHPGTPAFWHLSKIPLRI